MGTGQDKDKVRIITANDGVAPYRKCTAIQRGQSVPTLRGGRRSGRCGIWLVERKAFRREVMQGETEPAVGGGGEQESPAGKKKDRKGPECPGGGIWSST